MRIKISFFITLCLFFGLCLITPDLGFCVEEEVYSKLPKNPDGDPALSEEEWDKVDDILSSSKSSCVRCHYGEEKYEKLVTQWYKNKHGQNKVDCSRCHGGNPDKNSLGKAKGPETKFKKLDPRFKTSLIASREELEGLAFEYCGQCHGTIFRDWKTGIHGKRTGLWNGKKEYRLCIRCHNPHNPKFPHLKPLPPPVTPYNVHERYFSGKKIKGVEK